MNFFKNNYLLSEIAVFLRYNEIISLSMCSKELNKLLDNNNNTIINTIFLFTIIDEYFELDLTNYKNENKKNLLGKNIDFGVDWKLFLKHFRHHFALCKDKEIRQKVHDFFKIHIYLPDLRKECYHLEFEKSSINELYSYDINSRLIHTYHYYSKYINFENLILNPENKCQVKILREKLKFEEDLINFSDLFNDFVNNIELSDFVNNTIIQYKFEDLYDMYNNDFHTLVLLDIKVKEISEENLIKGKKIYEKPRFMSVNIGLEELLEASKNCKRDDYRNLINEDSLCFGVARIGSDNQIIKAGKIKDIIKMDFGNPLHSIVICGKTLFNIEKEVFDFYLKKSS